MEIKPSAAIRQNYNEVSALCKRTKAPVYLTKNGEGDLVVMDIEAFHQREQMLELREQLLAVQEDRARGVADRPASDVAAMMRDAIREARHGDE